MSTDDRLKDAVVGMSAIALAAGAAPSVLAAAAGGLVAFGVSSIVGRDDRRARKMFERLLHADEAPEDFAAYLNERLINEDEEVIGAFRSLLTAAFDAVSPAALDAMALLANRLGATFAVCAPCGSRGEDCAYLPKFGAKNSPDSVNC